MSFWFISITIMRITTGLIYRFCIMELKTPLYLLSPKKYELDTVIAANEGGSYEFQDSIFHLQGGGQPNDRGWIQAGEDKF